MSQTTEILMALYEAMRRRFGHQHWWPGDGAFEIMVGAVLTQNTAWRNVEKAILNLKNAGVLEPRKMLSLEPGRLAALIKPAGYYNVKAARLREFLLFLKTRCDFDIKKLRSCKLAALRTELLAVKGIGEETADSMLLYALGKPAFVVDAYTRRVLERHMLAERSATYGEIKMIFEDNLRANVGYFKDFHAQIVMVGKEFCRPKKPACEKCPLAGWAGYGQKNIL